LSADVHRLVVIDATPGTYGELPVIRVELLDDVEVICKETGQTVTLQRGRHVVVEESVLQASGEGWS